MVPRRFRALPLLLVLTLAACSPRARRFVGYRLKGSAPKMTCRTDKSARWCLHEPRGAASRDIVYFFHYATGDEGTWARLGLARAFFGEYARLGAPAPRVVSVSFGTHWLITRTPGGRQTVQLADFDDLRGRIEKTLGPVEHRYAWGMSQGGYNAAVVALSEPGTWAAVALSCPALLDASPFATPSIDSAPRALEGRQLFTFRLAGESAWIAENPIALAASAKPVPPIWIEANKDDEFGFAPGARALADALRAAGGSVQLTESAGGGHCWIDARAAARFLAGRP